MIKNILAIALLAAPLFITAQKGKDITVSKPYKVIDAASKLYFTNDTNMIAVKITGNKVSIQKFNPSLPGFEKAKSFKDMPKKFVLESMVDMGGKLWMFYSIEQKGSDDRKLYAREIEYTTGTFKDKAKMLVKPTLEPVPAAASLRMHSNGGYMYSNSLFGFYTSYDKSKLLIQYRLKPEIKRDRISHEIDGLYVFDSDMKQISGEEKEMPYTEKKMNIMDFSVDGEGNTYIVSQVFNDDTEKIKKGSTGNANYHMELFRFLQSEDRTQTSKINVKDNFICSVGLFEGAGNRMICAGFYNQGKTGYAAYDFWNNSSVTSVDGVFAFDLDKAGIITRLNTFEIPIDLIAFYNAKKAAKLKKKNKDPELYHMQLRDVVVLEDGGVLILGEQFHQVVRRSYGPTGVGVGGIGSATGAGLTTMNSRTQVEYYYEDILATRIDASGELKWMKRLPKCQIAKTANLRANGYSYQYVYEDKTNSHYMVYLDNIKNENKTLQESQRPHKARKSYLTYFKIDDKSGDVSRTFAVNMKNADGYRLYQFAVSRIMESKDGFIFEAYKKDKEDVLIKVNLD